MIGLKQHNDNQKLLVFMETESPPTPAGLEHSSMGVLVPLKPQMLMVEELQHLLSSKLSEII